MIASSSLYYWIAQYPEYKSVAPSLYRLYTLLSARDFAVDSRRMPLHADMLSVRDRRHRALRRVEGVMACGSTHLSMPSAQQRRIRPGHLSASMPTDTSISFGRGAVDVGAGEPQGVRLRWSKSTTGRAPFDSPLHRRATNASLVTGAIAPRRSYALAPWLTPRHAPLPNGLEI